MLAGLLIGLIMTVLLTAGVSTTHEVVSLVDRVDEAVNVIAVDATQSVVVAMI